MAKNTKIHNVGIAYNRASKRFAVLVNGTHALHALSVKPSDELRPIYDAFLKRARQGKKFDPKDTKGWVDIRGMNGWVRHEHTVMEHDALSAENDDTTRQQEAS